MPIANMGGFRLNFVAADEQNLESIIRIEHGETQSTTLVLNAIQFAMMLRDGGITELPDLSDEDIQDKSKSDPFTKLVVLVQILWLVISIPTRAGMHYSTSQLEVLTLAFAVCSLLSYVFSWHKPQDVGTAFVLKGQPGFFHENETRERIIKLRQGQADSFRTAISAPGNRPKGDQLFSRIPNDSVSSLRQNLPLIIILLERGDHWLRSYLSHRLELYVSHNDRTLDLARIDTDCHLLSSVALLINGLSAGLAISEKQSGEAFASTLFDISKSMEAERPKANRPFSQIPDDVKVSIARYARYGLIET
ncbi:uncharacterized protein LY89DRAFT_322174 [Mollisia scopiformis]|uniref:Uncharacterized protein n=1 Tax=Mollisia scopiformis TaxID=149040 RepID=A0A132B9H3_MOLSC|nr:uncharacterized protein LY89DRAFT_322174 [Mollisia scopiformis]KUJ08649.1 hypothetical protein LY89DRAFT_322174 [Mollisia scopiformis]